MGVELTTVPATIRGGPLDGLMVEIPPNQMTYTFSDANGKSLRFMMSGRLTESNRFELVPNELNGDHTD
jgi:hypothetical protein